MLIPELWKTLKCLMTSQCNRKAMSICECSHCAASLSAYETHLGFKVYILETATLGDLAHSNMPHRTTYTSEEGTKYFYEMWGDWLIFQMTD